MTKYRNRRVPTERIYAMFVLKPYVDSKAGSQVVVSPLYALRLKMIAFQAGGVVLAALFLTVYGAGAGALRFAAVAAVVLASAYPALAAWYFAPLNCADVDAPLRRAVGPANYLTLARGVLIAVLFGLIVMGYRDSRGAWLVVAFYGASLIGDLVDGFVARRRGETSILGRHLENEVDSMACLAASAALVLSEKLPWYFLAVGLARYLFLLAVWVRAKLGLPTHALKHSRSGRWLAGFMMNYMLVAMLPFVATVFAQRVMPIFFVPFLAGFVRDFYGVCTGRALLQRNPDGRRGSRV